MARHTSDNLRDFLQSNMPGIVQGFSFLRPGIKQMCFQCQLDEDHVLLRGIVKYGEEEQFGIVRLSDWSVEWPVDLRESFGVDPAMLGSAERIQLDPEGRLVYHFEPSNLVSIWDTKNKKHCRIAIMDSEDSGGVAVALDAVYVSADRIFLFSPGRLRIVDKQRFLSSCFSNSSETRELCFLNRNGLEIRRLDIPLLTPDERGSIQVYAKGDRIWLFRLQPGVTAFSRVVNINLRT